MRQLNNAYATVFTIWMQFHHNVKTVFPLVFNVNLILNAPNANNNFN